MLTRASIPFGEGAGKALYDSKKVGEGYERIGNGKYCEDHRGDGKQPWPPPLNKEPYGGSNHEFPNQNSWNAGCFHNAANEQVGFPGAFVEGGIC